MKKIEHFKSMIKAIKDKKALAGKLVNDLADSDSKKETSDDDMPVNEENTLDKANMKKTAGAPKEPSKINIHHPEHGAMEAYVHHTPKGPSIAHYGHQGETVHTAEAHGEHQGGMNANMQNQIKQHALKLGPGDHSGKPALKMKKSEENMKEYTAEAIVLQALKNVKEKRDLTKAEEMKREEGKAEDTGSIYNEEQEMAGSNDIAEAAKREQGQLQAKKLKEFVNKAKNKSEKKANPPKKEENNE